MFTHLSHVYPSGSSLYLTYLFLLGANPDEALDRAATIKRAASDMISGEGATITHHHAVGRDHRPWYDRQRPEPFATALRAAKAAVDPAGILNPGVLF